MKTVLITRSQDQAQEVERLLKNSGFDTFIEPLFFISQLSLAQISEPKKSLAKAAIITSANAISSLVKSGLPKDIKLFAVGKKTAEKLMEKGFNNIAVPQENSAIHLKNLIIETQDKVGLILYFHGSTINLDFEIELQKSGFQNVEKILAYQTSEIENFSAELLDFANHKNFDHILFFSTGAVKTFFNLAKKNNLLEYFSSAQLLCLSENILAEAQKFNLKNSATFAQFPTLKKFYD